jgi:hypothetical protein
LFILLCILVKPLFNASPTPKITGVNVIDITWLISFRPSKRALRRRFRPPGLIQGMRF